MPVPVGDGTATTRVHGRELPQVRLDTAARLLAAAGVHWVRMEMADTHGIARSKTVPLTRFVEYGERGLSFYGGTLTQDASGDDVPRPGSMPPHDFLLRPDLDTLAVLPHAPGEARVVCDLYRLDGEPVRDDGRWVLRQVVDAFRPFGVIPRTGVEYEFYLIHRETRVPAFSDRQVYGTLRNNLLPGWRDDLMAALHASGIQISTFGAENAPGQFEVTFTPADGVAAADQAFAFRTVTKETARNHGYDAPFMTKPFIDEAASGCHLHHSLIDAETGENRFFDPADPYGMSRLAKHFLAGQLYHASAMTAFLSPTPNDYKRYQPGSFAPVNVTWGHDNRSAAFRVPAGAAGAHMRIENRLGGAAANPYIAIAASLAAGLDGIRNELPLIEPVLTDASQATGAAPLPRSLDQALDALEADAPLGEALGAEFIRTYLLVKRFDIAKARLACPDYGTPEWMGRVDPYEWREYGELI